MTTPRNVDKLIESYLADGPVELPDRSFDVVRDEIERTRQRWPIGLPAWWRMSDSGRLLVVAAVLVVAFVGFTVAQTLGPRVSTVPSTTPPPVPAVTATPNPSPGASVAPGTFTLTADFPVKVSMELPNRWSDCSNGPLEQGVCSADGLGGVNLMVIDNVVADPCADTGLNPPVGPSVDDLVQAISGLRRFQATAPIDVMVDGHPGKEFTVRAPSAPSCSLYTWMGPDRTNGVGAGEANRLRVVEVDGVRVLIAAPWFPSTLKPDLSPDVIEVFESVRFP